MSHKAFDAAVHFASTNDLPIAVLHVADPDKSHLPGHFDPNFLMFQFERKCVWCLCVEECGCSRLTRRSPVLVFRAAPGSSTRGTKSTN